MNALLFCYDEPLPQNSSRTSFDKIEKNAVVWCKDVSHIFWFQDRIFVDMFLHKNVAQVKLINFI